MQWFEGLLLRFLTGDIVDSLKEKAEGFEKTKKEAMEVLDAIINFPYLGIFSYGIFFVIILFFAIVVIFLLVWLLKKE